MGNRTLEVESADSLSWSDTADVLVVGFGGAGVTAALQARECGADVLSIDRFAGGGATAFSGGVIYAGGTPYQRDSGFNDTPEEMFKYLSAEGSAVGPETLRRFCEGSAADLAWLESHGVPHGANAYTGKTNFPPPGHWIYYSGNEKLAQYAAVAKPAPRGHLTKTTGFGGRMHFDKLRESAQANGVRLLPHAPVTRLVLDRQGKLLGVEVNALPESLWKEHDRLYQIVSPWRPFNGDRSENAIKACAKLEAGFTARRLIRARRGVILASGGFVYNLSALGTVNATLAANYRNLQRLGSMGDDGSGLELGQAVGGVTALMERICIARILSPPFSFPHGIMVNSRGERFIAEDAYSFVLGKKVAEQPQGGRAWLVLKASDFWLGLRQSLFPGKGLFLMWGAPALLNIFFGGTKRARTLAALAQKCGVDPQGLQRTVTNYNRSASTDRADPLGKYPELLTPIEDSAYFAVNVSLDNRFAAAQTFTLGGLKVDEKDGTIVRADGTRVEGLFAAGRTAVGLCSQGYMSGMSIADTVFSGRRAGRAAAIRRQR